MCDIPMIQRRQDLCLSLEASEPARIRREGIGQHLQGIVALQSGMVSTPDLAHSAFAEQGSDLIRPDASAEAEGHLCGLRIVVRARPSSHSVRRGSVGR
jgi:hypothetical protein